MKVRSFRNNRPAHRRSRQAEQEEELLFAGTGDELMASFERINAMLESEGYCTDLDSLSPSELGNLMQRVTEIGLLLDDET